jgi:hypothetical protein
MNIVTMKDYPKMETQCKLSSSESLVSVTSTLSDTSSESGDDGDYGLYEDFEDETTITAKISTVAAPSSSSHLKTSKLVIYTVKNSHAHVSCRSFEKNKTSSVHISMTGVRIVQDSSGLQAEYHVKMVIGLVEYNSWKTFNDFQEIAKACMEVCRKKKSFWSALFATLMENKNVYRISRGSKRLTKTLLAWDNVILERSKRNWFKHLSVSSLMAESNALQLFLECLLFEIPDIDILIEFLA